MFNAHLASQNDDASFQEQHIDEPINAEKCVNYYAIFNSKSIIIMESFNLAVFSHYILII